MIFSRILLLWRRTFSFQWKDTKWRIAFTVSFVFIFSNLESVRYMQPWKVPPQNSKYTLTIGLEERGCKVLGQGFVGELSGIFK